MAKIILRRVVGFNLDQLLDRSIVKFLDFRCRNSPFWANTGLLSGLPSSYALPLRNQAKKSIVLPSFDDGRTGRR